MVQAFDVNVWSALQAGIDMLELEEIVDRPSWQADALCRERPDVDFFPPRGAPTEPARAVCAECLCRAECLGYAFARSDIHGMWGGTSEKQRKIARRQGWTAEELLAEVDSQRRVSDR